MLTPKHFLIEECKNVERSLKESLRHDYGGKRSQDFYAECNFRLVTLQRLIKQEPATNLPELHQYAINISALSELIARIERSHLGEFSWPFAYELEELANATCQGVTGSNDIYEEPIFAISAEGGLDAYMIHHEQEKFEPNIRKRIFNIVFPRTLKHHVLLHPILGHEIGHAATTIPNMDSKLGTEVLAKLEGNGPLSDHHSLSDWLKERDKTTKENVILDPDQAEELLHSWGEEFLCDLFGLVLFGPSFIAAHFSLLCAIDPVGISLGEEHPPNVSRFDMLNKAIKVLGWEIPDSNLHSHLKDAINEFWKATKQMPSPIPSWAQMFTEQQVEAALQSLITILDQLTPALYKHAEADELEHLVYLLCNMVPPIGAKIESNADTILNITDFRSILYAGWLVWHGKSELKDCYKELSFFDINRLCGQAIMQQKSINIMLSNRKKSNLML